MPMLFASTELAARVERAEVRLLVDCARSIEQRRPAADVVRIPCAGGVAVHAGPDSPFNKLAGLGFDGTPSAAELEQLEREFDARATPVRAEVATLAAPGVFAVLAGRGYALVGFENVSGRILSRSERFDAIPGVVVKRGGSADLDAWLDTVVTGFAHPDAQGTPSDESFPRDVMERDIGDMLRVDGFDCFLAHRDGALAGGASYRECDGLVQMCGAATLPAHRRNGVQTALLQARLRAAAADGCDLALVTTQPGSKSHENVQRQGFELLYARAVLVRSPRPAKAAVRAPRLPNDRRSG